MIRSATTNDIPALCNLTYAAYGQLLSDDYPASVLRAALPAMVAVTNAYLSEVDYRVWDEGEGPLGAVGWSIEPNGAAVRKLAVHPVHLSRGIGRRLMVSIEGDAAIAGFDHMTCAASLTAVPFYKRCGYQIIGPDVIATPEVGVTFDIVRMVKEL